MNFCKFLPFLPLFPLLLFLSAGGIYAIQSSSKIAESSRTVADEGGDFQPPPPISNPICRLPMDRGANVCAAAGGNNSNGGVKWYFDVDTLECLAFGFRGCGGNANKFDSIFDCRRECQLPADYGGCSGRKGSAKNAQGETIICAGPPNPSQLEKCPAGYRCQNMAFYGICCEIKTEEMYSRNYRPKCANGKRPHQIEDRVNNWPVMFLAKSCRDQPCPAGMDCVGQEIFAHCCPK